MRANADRDRGIQCHKAGGASRPTAFRRPIEGNVQGKSFVVEVFRELGAYALDADQTAREVVMPGTEGLEAIEKAFGNEILRDGVLDRAKLGAIVFADEKKRLLLNSIVHPLVFAEQDRWVRSIESSDPDGIAIIDAALLIESGGYRRFDKLIVVWCESAIQLARLMARDGLSKAEAEKRISAQMPQEEKRRYADLDIDTSNGYEETRQKTIEVFGLLRVFDDSGRNMR
ncbi:MAG: dephospho-CoA kinase [Acidobacteriota bacterium]